MRFIGKKIAPYNPISNYVIEQIFDLLPLTSSDLIIELGCGNAQFTIMASEKFGCKGIGYDYDLKLIDIGNKTIKEKNLSDRITLIHQDITKLEPSQLLPGSVIFLYLTPDGIESIEPLLITALQNNCKIITYIFSIPNIKPCFVSTTKMKLKIYFYDLTSVL